MVNFEEWSEKEVMEYLDCNEKKQNEYFKYNKINSVLCIEIGLKIGLFDEILDNEKVSKLYLKNLQNEDEVITKINEYDYIIICNVSSNEEINSLAESVADICFKLNKKFMICHCCYPLLGLKVKPQEQQNKDNFVKNIESKKYIINEIPYVSGSVNYDKFELLFKGEKYYLKLFTQSIATKVFSTILSSVIEEIIKKRG